MLLISVYSKSVSLCILAYYNEIRKRGRPCGRKSLHFKRRVVEVYRAEIAQPADIERYLHIPLTELRRLNRWYFKHQLAPYLCEGNVVFLHDNREVSAEIPVVRSKSKH